MHYKSILLAFVATSLVAAAPTPEDATTVPPQAGDISADNALGSDDATIARGTRPVPLTYSLLNTSGIVVPGNAPGVVFPEWQSTHPGHTWPLVQCKIHRDQAPPEHFNCKKNLLAPYGYPDIAILTWDTNKIKIGNSCKERKTSKPSNKDLPLSWVCVKPDGTNNLEGAKSTLQRGFWKDMDCYKHYDHEVCHDLKKGMKPLKEVVDENGVEWDEARKEDGGQGW